MSSDQLGIAILGCGQIADAHLGEIAKLDSVRVVAVCDTRPELAEQAAARFAVPSQLTSLDALLDRDDVDVIHICTPAHTHGPLTTRCLEAGKSVYVEKPFTVDVAEAREVVDVARRSKGKLCLGHDQLFDPAWLRVKQIVASGKLGAVRHVKSHVGYALSGPFGREVTTNREHWVHKLKGGLFQNTISHPLYRITEFVTSPDVDMTAVWLHNGNVIPADLRVSLWGKDDVGGDVTGTLLFTSNVKPNARITRVYGEEQSLEVDFDAQVIRMLKPFKSPGAFQKLERPAYQLFEAAGNLARNAWRFARGDIHYFHGMRNLFDAFYDSIRNDSEPPIPYDEMVRFTGLMDDIFDQCRERESGAALLGTEEIASRPTPAALPQTVIVNAPLTATSR